MQLKHILCTLFALGIVGTAHAADDIITGGDGTCNETVLGTSENLATANTIATWSLNEYDCPAGQYLLVDGDNIACTPCASGSYCPGGIFTVESENKGTNICPTDYASSATGSDSQSDCYTGCSATCKQQPVPTHAINVTHGNETSNGKLYYGGSCDANAPICSMTFQCATGYHKRPDLTEDQALPLIAKMEGVSVEDLPEGVVEDLYLNWDAFFSSASAGMQQLIISEIDKVQHSGNKSGLPIQPYWDLADEALNSFSENSYFMPISKSYTYSKGLDSVEKCFAFDAVVFSWSGIIPAIYGEQFGDEIDCDIAAQQDSDLAAFRQSAQNGDWFLTIPERDIMLSGKSKCELDGTYYQPFASYVNVQGINMPEVWWLAEDVTLDSQEECENLAAEYAATATGLRYLARFSEYRDSDYLNSESIAPLLVERSSANSNPYITYVCDANKIGIDWNPDDGSENIAGMCYYGGDVNIPEYVPTKPGYTFKGWKLVTE